MRTACLLVAMCLTAEAGEIGRLYAQQKGYTPGQQRWFREQKVPGQNTTCCSVADGEEVQEDIRGEFYWIKGGKFSEWTRVPKEAVLDVPNMIGQPVVWWSLSEEQYVIRCYAPGPKM